jgi:hypothetical protein
MIGRKRAWNLMIVTSVMVDTVIPLRVGALILKRHI